jgi:hypothetical protein
MFSVLLHDKKLWAVPKGAVWLGGVKELLAKQYA